MPFAKPGRTKVSRFRRGTSEPWADERVRLYRVGSQMLFASAELLSDAVQ